MTITAALRRSKRVINKARALVDRSLFLRGIEELREYLAQYFAFAPAEIDDAPFCSWDSIGEAGAIARWYSEFTTRLSGPLASAPTCDLADLPSDRVGNPDALPTLVGPRCPENG